MKKTFTLLAAALLLVSCGNQPQVNYKVWYDWPERNLPADFATLGEPDVQGVKTNLDLEDLDDTKNHFCALFETTLPVKQEEEYNFTLTTDDGSRFYVDGELLIVNDGAHGPIEKKVSKVLSKGKHALKIEFFDFDKGQTLVFKYATSTIPERELDNTVMAREDKASNNKRFVKPQAKEAFQRFKAWKGKDDVLVFPILTDIHTCGRFSYKHIGYASTVADIFNADFMALLGDIGLNTYPATVNAEYAQSIVDNTRDNMLKYKGMWLFSPGNHDWDAGEGRYYTEEELSEIFQQPWQEKGGKNLHLMPGKTYGWYDIPQKNFRIIFLNSEATRTKGEYYYCYGDEQLAWLDGLLEATPEGMNVLLLSHWMPQPMGVWNAVSLTRVGKEPYNKITDLLASYAGKINLVGLFTGDSHVNNYTKKDGVNYYITQGYGWVSPDVMIPGQKHAVFDYRESLCIDVVAVKPATREVHTFRVGAGGPDFDYTFTY